MALNRVKTWSLGDVLTANDLNAEFNNITLVAIVEPFVATAQVDLNGNLLICDTGGDSYLDASTNNTLKLYIAGAEDFRLTANTWTLLSGSSLVLDAGNITSTSGSFSIVDGQTTLADPDARTNTVATPLIIAA